ncbi:mitochondrial UPF0041 domain-containing protein 1 (pyruvate transporter) [Andalucia godoyi]|uniref:Mitochondrial pyruvate carrier n=1 Tax=Andalucia godoyi TaxID=505711 RepID=A0A8K0F484_ANDGO|nr:mitochondrial UPF0041 domain-containing protein 1 (pyruvate transporter) [Andalucia godoyi]|eukprot:ANDGO_08256.mRNA.1 mitochondrial UPF0041 domain-containing protein 1 (pyruvate transporter)
MSFSQKLRNLWNHPAGPKTVFFWAPTMKWGLVVAGLSDLKRSPERISLGQSGALAATGTIWSRYATQIIPYNYNLLFVNVFVAATGFYQIYRRVSYDLEQSEKAKLEQSKTS